jgi:hypothetical protein
LEATQIEGGEDDSGDEIFVDGTEVGDPLHLASQISDTDIIFMILRDIVIYEMVAYRSQSRQCRSRLGGSASIPVEEDPMDRMLLTLDGDYPQVEAIMAKLLPKFKI